MKQGNLAGLTGRLVSAGIMTAGMMIAASSAQSASLIKNGQFLTTLLSSPGGYICSSGQKCSKVSNVVDWISSCDINGCGNHSTPDSLLFASTNGSAFNGNYGLYNVQNSPGGGNIIALDGTPKYGAVLSQDVSGLIVNDVYKLSFYEAGAQQKGQTGATTEDFKVTFGSDTQYSSVLTTPSKGFAPWILQTLSFKATSASEVLTFFGEGTPAGEPPVALLSDVSLNAAVPEPATWAFMSLGVGGIGLLHRSNRRKVSLASASAE